MQEGKKYGVFISYSHDDAEFVRPIVQLVSSMRKDLVFLDTIDLLPGKKWEPQLLSALDEAEMVLVFWCHHSEKSANVRKEFEYALDRGKDIIPLLLDGTALDSTLTAYQWIDFRYVMNHQYRKVKIKDVQETPLLKDYFDEDLHTGRDHFDSHKSPLLALPVLVFLLITILGIVLFWDSSRPFYLNILISLGILISLPTAYVFLSFVRKRFIKKKKRKIEVQYKNERTHFPGDQFLLHAGNDYSKIEHEVIAQRIIDTLSKKFPVR